MIDLIIRNGKIIDGTGNSSFLSDIVVNDGLIVEIEKSSNLEAKEEWNALGKVICPGFIDIHSHADFSLLADRRNESAIRQGITTVVTGNCGHGPAPAGNHKLVKQNTVGFSENWGVDIVWDSFSEYLECLFSQGLSVNVAPLVPHGTVRLAVLGHSKKKPTIVELEKMKSLVEESMSAGAIGISTGLEYSPGIYADEQELTVLASDSAKYNGIYASHIRNRGEKFKLAVKEALNICSNAGLPAQLSHLAPRPYAPKGSLNQILDLVEKTRVKEGMNIGLDSFPDIWGPGTVAHLLPYWVYEGDHEEVLNRIKYPETIDKCRKQFSNPSNFLLRLGGLDKFYLVSSKSFPELIGKNFIEIGDYFSCDPIEGIFKLLLADGTDYYNVLLRHIYATKTDLDHLLLNSNCSLGSDGVVSAKDGVLADFTMNRSSYGYTIRFIKEYVLERKMFKLEEAIRKMTSLPAESAGLSKRGSIEKNKAADFLVLNLKELSDNSSDESPNQYPSGVELVVVNGKIVMEKEKLFNSFPGKHAKK